MSKVRIVQVFRVEREIVIEVDGDIEQAVEEVKSGSVEAPPFDDPRWRSGWSLENEEVSSA